MKPNKPLYRLDGNYVSELFMNSPATNPYAPGARSYTFRAYRKEILLLLNCYTWQNARVKLQINTYLY